MKVTILLLFSHSTQFSILPPDLDLYSVVTNIVNDSHPFEAINVVTVFHYLVQKPSLRDESTGYKSCLFRQVS